METSGVNAPFEKGWEPGVIKSGMGRKDCWRIKCTNLANSLIKVGMTTKNSELEKLSAAELQWIKQLREHPELRDRLAMIMEITSAANGPVKSADEVEGLLIQELRRLGNTAMASWAAQAEQVLGARLKAQDASARVLKKKG